MMKPMKAIPTIYKGCQFRSRLEATWAAFFDLVEWEWEYEPFDFDGYIPDFLLRIARPTLVEVKPATTIEQLQVTAQSEKIRPMRNEWKDEILILGVGRMPANDDWPWKPWGEGDAWPCIGINRETAGSQICYRGDTNVDAFEEALMFRCVTCKYCKRRPHDRFTAADASLESKRNHVRYLTASINAHEEKNPGIGADEPWTVLLSPDEDRRLAYEHGLKPDPGCIEWPDDTDDEEEHIGYNNGSDLGDRSCRVCDSQAKKIEHMQRLNEEIVVTDECSGQVNQWHYEHSNEESFDLLWRKARNESQWNPPK